MFVGIDLGRNLGWVRGAAVGPLEYGTFVLKDTTDLGQYMRSADGPMRQLVANCTSIAVEKPDTRGNNYSGILKNFALLSSLAYWNTWNANVPIERISVPTAKLTLAGHGHAKKEQMIEAAAAMGFPGMNEHEADALAVWKVHVFGRREPIAKSRAKSGKGRSVIHDT